MRAKKKVTHRGVFWNVAALFLLILILTGAAYSSVTLDIGKFLSLVNHIIFIGNKHLTDDELMAFTGIHKNESLVTISNKKVSQGLLKSPWIRSVSVRKEFPDTLSIVIEEAVPFALLDMNGHLFLVDENGKLLEELKDNAIPFLPIITGDPFKESKGFLEALHLAKLMNDKGFSLEKNHIEIIACKPQELTVTIDGTVVKVGSGEYEEKLKRLFELEDEIKRKISVDYIDLRFANRVIVKPIKEVIK